MQNVSVALIVRLCYYDSGIVTCAVEFYGIFHSNSFRQKPGSVLLRQLGFCFHRVLGVTLTSGVWLSARHACEGVSPNPMLAWTGFVMTNAMLAGPRGQKRYACRNN